MSVHRGCAYWKLQKNVYHFKSFWKYSNLTCFHDVYYVLQRWRAGVHHNLPLMENTFLKNLPFSKHFFFIDNSKRRRCNPFKCYHCFFSMEVSQGGQLSVTISSGGVSTSGRRAGLNTEAETTSSTTSPEKRLLCLLSVYQGWE